MPSEYIHTKIGQQTVKLSNLEKILYPSIGVSKAEIIQYYLKVSQYILPYIEGRALTLIRFPDGINQHSFYTKNKPDWTPEWMPITKTPWDDDNVFIMVKEAAHMVWLANLAALEIHNINSRSGTLLHPDHFIIDLDPSEGRGFDDVKQMAFDLNTFLKDKGYIPFVKTSGGKGLHLWVPITATYTYAQMLSTCKQLMQDFVKEHPDATLKLSKEKRTDKILLDIYRNHPANTTASPFSLRGKKGAPVSMPIDWTNLESVTHAQAFHIRNAIDYLSINGNPWVNMRQFQRPLHDQITHSSPINSKSIKPFSEDIFEKRFEHMLCKTTIKLPVVKSNNSFEIKWDGIRVFMHIKDSGYKLFSRAGRDITSQFPDFQEAPLIDSTQAVLDGELVCLDERGISDFSAIISRMHSSGTEKIKQLVHTKKVYLFVFDCLIYNEQDIRQLALSERRKYLINALANHPKIKLSKSFKEGKLLLEQARDMGLEGIIIKKEDSKYFDGARSESWLKLKFRDTIDCFIAGYTAGKGDRSGLFGSLHLVSIENQQIIYRGRVGSGFNHETIGLILGKLNQLKTTTKPFEESTDEEKNSTWIELKYQCEVQFASLTNNGTLREPVFIKMIESVEEQNN